MDFTVFIINGKDTILVFMPVKLIVKLTDRVKSTSAY